MSNTFRKVPHSRHTNSSQCANRFWIYSAKCAYTTKHVAIGTHVWGTFHKMSNSRHNSKKSQLTGRIWTRSDTTENVAIGEQPLDSFRKMSSLDTTERAATDKWILDTTRKLCNPRRNSTCRNAHTNRGDIPQSVQVSTHPKMTQVTKKFGTHSAKCPDTIKHVAVPHRRNQKSRNWQTNSGHMPPSNSRRVVPRRIQGHHKPNGLKPRCFSNCPRQRIYHSA